MMIVNLTTLAPASSLPPKDEPTGIKPQEDFAALLKQKVTPVKGSHQTGTREKKSSDDSAVADEVLTPPLLAMLPLEPAGVDGLAGAAKRVAVAEHVAGAEPATLTDLLPAADRMEHGGTPQLPAAVAPRLMENALVTARAGEVKMAPGVWLAENRVSKQAFSGTKLERKEGLSVALAAGFPLKSEPAVALDNRPAPAERGGSDPSPANPLPGALLTDTASSATSHPASGRSEFALLSHQSGPMVASSRLPAEADVDLLLDRKLGTPEWQQSLGHQLTLFTRNGIHNAELRLHPEELGTLQVQLRLNSDQAQLHFVTGNHQVKAALEAAMPQLRTMLEESGISLGKSSVGADASPWGASSQSGQDAQSSRQQQQDSDAHYDPLSNEQAPGAEAENMLPVQRGNLPDGINTFV